MEHKVVCSGIFGGDDEIAFGIVTIYRQCGNIGGTDRFTAGISYTIGAGRQSIQFDTEVACILLRKHLKPFSRGSIHNIAIYELEIMGDDTITGQTFLEVLEVIAPWIAFRSLMIAITDSHRYTGCPYVVFPHRLAGT